MALTNLQKGNLTMAEYLGKIKTLTDEVACAGAPLGDAEIISHVITDLDIDYNPVISVLAARVEDVTVQELYSQLLSFDARLSMLQGGNLRQSSVNVASRGRGRGRGQQWRGRGNSSGGGRSGNQGHARPGDRGNNGGDRGGGNNSYNGGYNSSYNGGYNNNNRRPRCQLCKKPGHEVIDCWHRYDEDFVPDTKHVAAAMREHGGADGDTVWYADSGATDHVTNELEKLALRERYHGNDQIHTASGGDMDIAHIGQSSINSPSLKRDLVLKDVLHVPQADKNLASMSRLTSDNNVFFETHPTYFFIKDRATKELIHHGRCIGGLYPITSRVFDRKRHCQVYSAIKPSLAKWHQRLGHPSPNVVKQVVNKGNLSLSRSPESESVCEACQCAKSHQLPYPLSNSVSHAPLELIFSDVCGHARDSFGRKKYYVSFIDDYSKFTWIYLLKFKSEVFSVFQEFQKLVERQFDRKILAVQSDWGGEYEKLNSFFRSVGIIHHVSCPHAHQQKIRNKKFETRNIF